MKQIIKKSNLIWLFILAISFIGCEDDDDTVLPQVVASFAHNINQDTGAVSFINLSENADSYTWDFGDNTTSTEVNPTKSFATGTYTIKLTAKNGAGASGTFEDEIVINIPLPINMPVNFDDVNVKYDVTSFNGAAFAIVENPDASGANAETTNVGSITNSGATYEGIYFDLGMALDLSTLKSVQANVWSDKAVDVLMKLEQGTGADVEAVASHGGTGWETVRFDFNSDASYPRITLFVDGPGTTAGTFYIDNFAQVETPEPTSGCDGDPVAAASLPLDFEGCATFPSADNFGAGITSEFAANPDKSGINTSSFVLKVDKPTDSDFYAGIQNVFANGLGITNNSKLKLKVYSTKANVVFRFELIANPNDGSIGNPAPQFVTIANANEWTELEVDFGSLPSADPAVYTQLVIKPDNDQTDSAITEGGTYYIDDIMVETSDDNNTGGTFDSGLLTNGDFENGATPWTIGVGADPVPVVIDNGNSYYSVNVEAAGNAYDVNMSQKLNLTEGATYTLTFDAWSDRDRTIFAGIGLSADPWTNTVQEVSLTTTKQTFTLTLTANGIGAPDARVLFDSGAQIGVVNIDNVALMLDGDDNSDNGDGTQGGGCDGDAVAATAFPVTFEGCESFINAFNADGSITTELADNPSKSGINTSDYVLKVSKTAGTNRWAGLQNSFPAGTIDITTKVFKLKVYSSAADVTYRFELALDPQTDPVTGNPAPVFVTVAGGANEWKEVEFTFANLPATPTTYNQLVIKPDNPEGTDGETTTEDRIYYFDDLRLE